MASKRRAPTRRQFTLSLGATLLLAACTSDDEISGGTAGAGGEGGAGGSGGTTSNVEPSTPWQPSGGEDTAAFATGVQVGDATAASAIVSVHTTETVSLRVAIGKDDAWEEIATLDDLTPDNGVVQVEVTDLEPDTGYSVVFYADADRRSVVARFRSALGQDASRIIRFGASSCLGGNQPWATLSHAADERLDFFLMLGDTIYGDSPPNTYDYETKWTTALGVQGLRDLAATTSFVATWDDHEVDNNWSYDTPGIQAKVDAGLTAFRRGMPQRLGPGGTQIWRKLSWGKVVDLFVLDCRGERKDGNYISPEQLAWLKDGLSTSTAQFKLVLNSVPITDFTGTLVGDIQKEDRWQGYPTQRSEIVSHIDDESIGGVLWLAGDFHIGGAGKISPPDAPGANAIEILCGPAGSPINPAAGLINPDERLLLVSKTWTYTLFEVDPDAASIRTVFIDDSGAILHEMTFTEL
ncbi:MAG: alkaline phosphatase D family protein [Polyangiaceae bacterium]